jgi:Na+/melibiose symporter-like transporter
MDVGGRLAGSLSGSMNMMGNLGSAAGAAVVGSMLNSSKISPTSLPTMEAWLTVFVLAATLYVLGGIAWLFIDPVTPLDQSSHRPTPAR